MHRREVGIMIANLGIDKRECHPEQMGTVKKAMCFWWLKVSIVKT
tara:strand:+ start:15018 stop:15152 length:135 start_codon:yes stop_codon:yes gene_type:complete